MGAGLAGSDSEAPVVSPRLGCLVLSKVTCLLLFVRTCGRGGNGAPSSSLDESSSGASVVPAVSLPVFFVSSLPFPSCLLVFVIVLVYLFGLYGEFAKVFKLPFHAILHIFVSPFFG